MKTITLLIATLLMIAASARALAQEIEEKGGGATASSDECAPLQQFRGAPVDLGCEETQASITTSAAAPYSVVQLDRFEDKSGYAKARAGQPEAGESKGSKGEQ